MHSTAIQMARLYHRLQKRTWEILRGKLVTGFRDRAKKKRKFEASQQDGVISTQEVGLDHSSEEVR